MKLLSSLICLLACSLLACDPAQPPAIKVIVGAALVNPPIPHSVIVIKDGKIVDIGPQQMVPVPTESEKINGIGKYVIPITPGAKLEAGAPADLLLVADPNRPSNFGRTMRAGQWVPQ